jgi:hypothetical protein
MVAAFLLRRFVGWAKALFAPCPPSRILLNKMVGTLRFAHPTRAPE